jgi:membrane fusion protein, multidrug efflux system
MSGRIKLIIPIVIAVIAIAGVWLWATSGKESTDDAQVDANVTPIAARVGGTVISVPVKDNQLVEAGAVIVELDKRDFEVMLERAKADVEAAEAAAIAAKADVPITSTTATSRVTTAQGGVAGAQAGVREGEQGVETARARLATAQARLREAEATANRTARDVERLKGLLAKDEVSQQQYDMAVGAADASRAAADSARSQVHEAELGISVAQSKLAQAGAAEQQARADLRTSQTGPEQVTATRARASAAEARVQQARAALKQAELNLQYATVRAPERGTLSRKSVQVGQVVQPGQPFFALVGLDRVWITANFKETQVAGMRPGQHADIEVDAFGGRTFKGHVDSLAAATGARFSLLPPDNATGNYVKVVQRVPVKIVLDEGQDPEHVLRPGMSVVPTVDTNK